MGGPWGIKYCPKRRIIFWSLKANLTPISWSRKIPFQGQFSHLCTILLLYSRGVQWPWIKFRGYLPLKQSKQTSVKKSIFLVQSVSDFTRRLPVTRQKCADFSVKCRVHDTLLCYILDQILIFLVFRWSDICPLNYTL